MEQTLKARNEMKLRDVLGDGLGRGRSGSANTGHLFSSEADSLLIGGASILFFMLTYALVSPSANINSISWTAYYLGFLVNWPHFLVSYQLLYGDNRKKLLKEPRFVWAGIVSPLLLAGVLGGFMASANLLMLGRMVNLMYLLVGWHYVKQIYGTAIFTSVLKRYYMSNTEKWALRINMYALWSLSWISQNVSNGPNDFYGIRYFQLGLPAWLQTAAYVATGVTLVGMLGIFVRKYVREGRVPPMSSLATVAAIYVWFIPALYHPFFFYMIPFFHSLQYLLFVSAFRRNKAAAQSAKLEGPAARLAFLKGFWGYMALSVVTGTLSFLVIPRFLDMNFGLASHGMGVQAFIYAFNIFINIHHYFIDNVIWRNTNVDLREYLVKPCQEAAA